MSRKTHRVRQTLLVVGEGDCEEAFLKHLRTLYCSGGVGVAVTICNAHGKGPENVIEHTARKARIYSYDQRLAFLDTDIAWTDKLKKDARKSKIEMIGSTPCLEGMLLSILERHSPEHSPNCKKALQQLLGVDLTERLHYVQPFPIAVLEAARQRISELHRLLLYFEGH